MTSFQRLSRAAAKRQAGLTLIELLVALALGTLIALAAVSALIVARQGFRSVDGGSQLRENARFAASLIQRVVVEAGFENAAYGFYTDPKEPGLSGFDNAKIDVYTGSSVPTMAHDTRSTCTQTDTSCANGDDILVVRYFGVSRNGAADGTIINCAGLPEPEGAQRAWSIFHVVRSQAGEPTLACTYLDPATSAWNTVPLVTGVEGFQVLYGVDTLKADGTAATDPKSGDTVADTYLTARELDTTPGASVTENWSRVRSVRIGMLIRGSAPDAVAPAASASMRVLGDDDRFVNSADIGSSLTIPADNRLRQRLVFTVHLRNAQYAP
jgi:type IV pilus assembly protein PilW